VHRLCVALRASGVDARVATTDDSGRSRNAVEADRWTTWEGVPVFYGSRLGWNGDLSPSLYRCINREVGDVDVVHVTAVYSWPTLSVALASKRSGTPYIVSPRGSLASAALEWRSWKKRLFSCAGGLAALQGASGFHATSEQEAVDVKAAVPGAHVCVVPNGTDVPDESELLRLRGAGRDSYTLFLGRLHPHKNPDLLLRAWARVSAKEPSYRLVFAGPDVAGLRAPLRELAGELGCSQRVDFAGPVDGDAKAALLARAKVVVLPSKSENFGNALAEALAHGTPVIATRGTPWSELGPRRCGWWVDADEESLASAIRQALVLDEQDRTEMGSRGRAWMAEAFSWQSVAQRMATFYAQVIETA
jgi:glycosyltransferase involved in cell wall biosynthesis